MQVQPVEDKPAQTNRSAAVEINDAGETGGGGFLQSGLKEALHTGTDKNTLVSKVLKKILLHALAFLPGKKVVIARNGQRSGRWRLIQQVFKVHWLSFWTPLWRHPCPTGLLQVQGPRREMRIPAWFHLLESL